MSFLSPAVSKIHLRMSTGTCLFPTRTLQDSTRLHHVPVSEIRLERVDVFACWRPQISFAPLYGCLSVSLNLQKEFNVFSVSPESIVGSLYVRTKSIIRTQECSLFSKLIASTTYAPVFKISRRSHHGFLSLAVVKTNRQIGMRMYPKITFRILTCSLSPAVSKNDSFNAL
jgi:hypothetical protein